MSHRFALRHGAFTRPMTGYSACGDRAFAKVSPDGGALFAVIDALGHGPDAERSAGLAADALAAHSDKSLPEIFSAVHGALFGNRGAVMAAISVSPSGEAAFAGVGNIEVFGPEGHSRPISMAGTLGGGSYRLRPFPIALGAGHRWVLCSDGLKLRAAKPALETAGRLPPEEAARSLVDALGRGHDDACALVIDFGDAAFAATVKEGT